MKNLLLLILLLSISDILAQTREQGPWWPHPIWGADDQAGASNWITPEKIVEASKWIKTGKTYELGHVYESQMFVPDNRVFKLVIPSFPTYGPRGDDQVVFNDELLVATIGQVGTQFDGLGHPGKQMDMADGSTTEVFYNGFTTAEMKNPFGLQKLGIEHIKPIVTSGLLIDVAAALSKDVLEDGYEVTLADVIKALDMQSISESDIKPGDAIFFNFGWWRNWNTDFVMDGSRYPRITRDVVDWLLDRQPSMVGSDAILDGDVYNVHLELTMKNGIFNLEWMNFQSLTEDQVYQFMFIFTPLPIKGATGSPGRPIAIH
jgi:kynurenine formamidase